MAHRNVSIVGAGPAGLTAAHELAMAGMPVAVWESDPDHVGGISRTVVRNGFRFDIGGHRFYSKSATVRALWKQWLPVDMLERPRLSRIFYGGHYYNYPLQPMESLQKLGIGEAIRCVASYARAQLSPHRNPTSFEDWVTNRFGRRLFEIFFRTYTEKVWGIRCTEISADWAAQRIQNLSLWKALLPRSASGGEARGDVKTLISHFHYPRLGPGMLWERVAELTTHVGGRVTLGAKVETCRHDPARDEWNLTILHADGTRKECTSSHLICTTPLPHLVRWLAPTLSRQTLEDAASLKHRDFILVAVILRGVQVFPDNWLYIHDPAVSVGRIQNFKSWSPSMVPDPQFESLGMEYFCSEGDAISSLTDDELSALARRELEKLGLASQSACIETHVVRQPKAYPVYDQGYKARVEGIRAELEEKFPTLHIAGRNGMHRYNNQDHSMMTGLLCARNILSGRKENDPWQVNQDAEYGEQGSAAPLATIPA